MPPYQFPGLMIVVILILLNFCLRIRVPLMDWSECKQKWLQTGVLFKTEFATVNAHRNEYQND